VTPGKDGSERSAMTATRLGRVGAPEAAGLLLDQLVVARSRSPALGLRLGLAGLAVASAVVGLVLFDDADPALWTNGYWAVRELLPAAIAFSIGGAVLLGYRKARWPAGALLVGGLLAGLALLFAGLWWDTMLKHGGFPVSLFIANGIATDLFFGLSLTVLPQLYPDGPLPGRLWKVLLGVSSGLVVLATLKNEYNFPNHQRFCRVVLLVDRSRARLAYCPRFADRPLAPWQSSAAQADCRIRHSHGDHDRRRLPDDHGLPTVPLLRTHCDRRPVAAGRGDRDRGRGAAVPPVRRPSSHPTRGGVRQPYVALTAVFVGVYFAVLAALSGQVVGVRYRWWPGGGHSRCLGR
jgi:hypothetical protein